ncbi:MAG: VOC family protein [Bacteroidales bacterium]|nr:VOC family protein [Bacteroidales bacterium]MCF8455499.1 VOC family protein [Bacteroidales bacterium]
MKNQITPCLWFDSEAEEAARFYTSIFKNSEIQNISRFGKEGFEHHGKPEGTVMTVDFIINGQPFTALNGGAIFTFSEAVSFQVFCESQEEIDHYWEKLTEGGQESMCGWLKDKFGVSWQIVPAILPKLMSDPAKAGKVTEAFLQMKKFDLEKLKQTSA